MADVDTPTWRAVSIHRIIAWCGVPAASSFACLGTVLGPPAPVAELFELVNNVIFHIGTPPSPS